MRAGSSIAWICGIDPVRGALLGERDNTLLLQRAVLVGVVGAAHLLLASVLLQMQAVRSAASEGTPVFVKLIHEQATPEQSKPAPRPQPPQQARPHRTPPVVATLATAPEPAHFDPPRPPPESSAATLAEIPAIVFMPTTPPSAPPQPRRISDVAYARPIEIEYPSLSRRLGETGRVVVRVLIDALGRPVEVIVHTTSGFARLDRAAIDAVHRALFRPYSENGTPAAAYALIALRFELN